VLQGRFLVDEAIVKMGAVAPHCTDDLIRWFCAYAVATKCFLRRHPMLPVATDG